MKFKRSVIDNIGSQKQVQELLHLVFGYCKDIVLGKPEQGKTIGKVTICIYDKSVRTAWLVYNQDTA